MNDTPQQQQPGSAATRAPKPPEKPPVIRMDRSRDFSTVHGDRPPGDPHARVCFYQKGLPFDAGGVLMVDHPEIADDPTKQAQVARLAKKAAMLKEAAPGDDAEDEQRDPDADEDADEDEDHDETVNLEAWARGDQNARWQLISDAITRRFSKRITGKRDALELLIASGVITIGGLSPKHRRIVQSD